MYVLACLYALCLLATQICWFPPLLFYNYCCCCRNMLYACKLSAGRHWTLENMLYTAHGQLDWNFKKVNVSVKALRMRVYLLWVCLLILPTYICICTSDGKCYVWARARPWPEFVNDLEMSWLTDENHKNKSTPWEYVNQANKYVYK